MTAMKPIEMPAVQTRLNADEEQALLRVLREGSPLATGPEGEAFEKVFSEFLGCADAVTVSDTAIAQATIWLRGEAGVMTEPSGAVTTAALRSGAIQPMGPTVLIVSGGNTDDKVLESLATFI